MLSVLLQVLLNFLARAYTALFLHAAFKIAYTVLAITIIVGIIVSYVQSYITVVAKIGQTMPDIVSGVWGWVMPSNTPLCMFSIGTVLLLRFVTKQFLKLINMKFKAGISN